MSDADVGWTTPYQAARLLANVLNNEAAGQIASAYNMKETRERKHAPNAVASVEMQSTLRGKPIASYVGAFERNYLPYGWPYFMHSVGATTVAFYRI